MLFGIAIIGVGIAFWQRHRNNQNALKKNPVVSLPADKNKSGTNQKLTVSRLWQDIKATIQTDGLQQLQIDIDSEYLEKITETKRKNRQNLLLSFGAAGLALLGTIYPVFYLLGAGAALYALRDMFNLVLNDFRRKRYLTVDLVGLISLLLLMLVGQLFLTALGGILGTFIIQIINQIEDNSQHQLLSVFGRHPNKVWVLKEGVEMQVDFHTLQPGDIVVINAGELIPVDGIVQTGEAQVDQHLLTGESQPVEKLPGDQVFAATLLVSGHVEVVVSTAGKTTLAGQIGAVLYQTKNYNYGLRERGRQVADRFAPVVLGLGAITAPLMGAKSAIAVVWSSLGETMAFSGPLSLLSYMQILSQHSILVKDGRVFELLRKVDTVIFDKTGTLTLEQPTLGPIHALPAFTVDTVLRYAAAAEYRQPHPVAQAILAKAREVGMELPIIDNASYEVGYGIKVVVEGHTVRVGSARFLHREGIELPESIAAIQQLAEADCHSLVYVALDTQLAGILEMQPTIRPEAQEMVRFLKQRGIHLYIISGDYEAPTRKIAENLGIEQYFAEVLPKNKAALVQKLRDDGRFVCFIGDGINDAIALKAAQVSFSLKGASTAATDTAQIIFMDGTLNRLAQLFEFADDFEDTMRRNFALSIIPGSITIGGVYLLHFGIAASMGIFYAGEIAALFSTLWPVVKYQQHEDSEAVPKKIW